MGLSLGDTSFAKFARQEGEEIGIEKGMKEGRIMGKEEGIKVGIAKVVMNMVKDGASVSYIAKVTDLSIEQVIEIEKKMNEK